MEPTYSNEMIQFVKTISWVFYFFAGLFIGSAIHDLVFYLKQRRKRNDSKDSK